MDTLKVSTLPNGVQVMTRTTSRFEGIHGVVDFAHSTRELSPHTPPGTAHAVEHLIWKQPREWMDKEIRRQCDIHGLNAWTAQHSWSIWFHSQLNNWEDGLGTIAEVLRSVRFRREVVDPELDVVKHEWKQSFSDPNFVLEYWIYRTIWKGTGMAFQPGEIRGLKTLPLSTYRQFLRDSMQGRKTVVAVCGPIEHEEVVRVVDSLFGVLPEGEPRRPFEHRPKGGIVQIDRPELDIPHMALGWVLPGLRSRNHLAGRMLAIAAISTELSELYYKVRQSGLSYGMTQNFDIYPECSVFWPSGAMNVTAINQFIGEVFAWFEKVKESGIDEKLLESTKATMVRELQDAVNDPLLWIWDSIEYLRVRKRKPPMIESQVEQVQRISDQDLRRIVSSRTRTNPTLVILSKPGAVKLHRKTRGFFNS